MPELHNSEFAEQGSTPATPASGGRKLYPKTGGWYQLDSTGTETQIGGVTGSTGATDNAVLTADGIGGGSLQATGVTIDDSDNITISGTITGQDGVAGREIELTAQAWQNSSTGIIAWDGMSILNATQVTLNAGSGTIVDNFTDQDDPTYHYVTWATQTVTITDVATDGFTIVYIDNTGTVGQILNALPTESQNKSNIVLGGVSHFSSTLDTIGESPEAIANPSNRLSTFMRAVGIVNSGVAISANASANLTIDRSAGEFAIAGAGWTDDKAKPDLKTIASASPLSFEYLTQSASSFPTGTTTTLVVPGSYDNAGTVTAISGASTRATNQRVYVLPNGMSYIQYGENIYNSLDEALSAINTESFTINPGFLGAQDSFLVGVISVTKGATDLTDSATARFTTNIKFDTSTSIGGSGTVGTLQGTYTNSSSPEITTDSTRGALTLQRGSAADTDNVLEIKNGAGTTTAWVDGNGASELLNVTMPEQAAPSTPASGDFIIYPKTDGKIYGKNDAGTEYDLTQGGGTGAPTSATYITQTPDATLTNEQALSLLATGIMKNTTATGVVSIAVDGADYVSPSGTATLTNKTIDANGTGNSISNIDVADLATGTDGELITWDASGNPATVAVGTSGHVLTSNGAGAAPTFQASGAGGGGLYASIAILRDEKATTVAGGSASAAAWNVRDLNTEVTDADSIVSIASNQLTPISGDYKITAFAPAFDVDSHRLRLYNVTGATSVQEGISSLAASASNESSLAQLSHVFTANGTDAYRIDHYTETARATNGLGAETGDGSSEVYLTIILEKLS